MSTKKSWFVDKFVDKANPDKYWAQGIFVNNVNKKMFQHIYIVKKKGK